MSQPFVSVLVPVRNEERYIERCLYSIAGQDYRRDRIEVLILDGMSEDATRQVVSRFAAESTLDLRLYDNLRRTAAAAMNLGLSIARGDLILRVDGHAALAPDYLRRCIAALDADGAECAGGVIESEGDTDAGRAIALAMASRFGVGGAAFRVGGGGVVDTVAFGVYRADLFQRLGGFAEDIERGEDDEFNYRLRDAGGVILLVPEARARYTVRAGLRGLWRQYFGYGRAKPEVLRRHPAQAQPRQFVPAAFVALVIGTSALAAAGRRRPLIGLLAAYGAANTAASVAAAQRGGWRALPLLPAAFACLHVAYGSGFIAGLPRAALGAGGLRGLMRRRGSAESEQRAR